MKPLISTFMQLTREPIAYAISYVEPDGTREVDLWRQERDAARWAAWCRRDGCADVTVKPVYYLPSASARSTAA